MSIFNLTTVFCFIKTWRIYITFISEKQQRVDFNKGNKFYIFCKYDNDDLALFAKLFVSST